MNGIIRRHKRKQALDKLRRRSAHRATIDRLISDAKQDLKEIMLRGWGFRELQHLNERIAKLQIQRDRKIE